MNGDAGDPRARARHLMMAALDDELPAGDRSELERLLAADCELQQEWEQLRRVKKLTGVLAYRKPPDEVWDDFWRSSYAQVERGLAWILISVGAVVLAGAGMYHAIFTLLATTGVPAYIKYALFAACLGVVLLGASVLREKLFVRSHDRYREVKR